MKILQIVHLFPPESVGGTELYTQAISRHLQGRGHQCHVLTGTGQTADSASRLDGGVHVTRLAGVGRKPGRWFPAHDAEMEDRVRRYLGDLKPDVVHIHHWVSLTANLVALCSGMGLPTIVTLHDLAVICPKGSRIRFDKIFCTDPLSTAPCLSCVERESWQEDFEVQEELMLRRQMINEGLQLADRLLIPSQSQKDFLAQFIDVPSDRLEILPHGTLLDLRPVGVSNKAASRRPLRIGHWGHLIWQKGPHLLLEAVRKLSDSRAVELHFMGEVGDPAYQQELHALAQGLIVTFHGAFTPADLAKLDLDVAVFPGLFHESHSFVLDEAFQLGLPVIVSSRGAPADRVGSAGLVFSAGVVGDLSAKMEALLADPALLEQLRRGMPKDPPHSMSEHIVALEEIYQRVIRSRENKSVSRPDYQKLLILRQHQLERREAAIEGEQIRYQQLHAQAEEYQAHLEQELTQWQGTDKFVKDQLQMSERFLEFQQEQKQELERVRGEILQLASLADDRDRWREAAEGLSRHANELERQYKWQEMAWGLQGQLDELGQQIKSLSQERDQLKNTIDRLLAHSAIRLYLRARGFLISPSGEV